MCFCPTLRVLAGDKEVGKGTTGSRRDTPLTFMLVRSSKYYDGGWFPVSDPTIQASRASLLIAGTAVDTCAAHAPNGHLQCLTGERIHRGDQRIALEHKRNAQGIKGTHRIEMDWITSGRTGGIGVCGVRGRIGREHDTVRRRHAGKWVCRSNRSCCRFTLDEILLTHAVQGSFQRNGVPPGEPAQRRTVRWLTARQEGEQHHAVKLILRTS